MKLLSFTKARFDLARAILPTFGAASLFWWSFTGGIPVSLHPFISPTDSVHLMGGLLVNVVAALFFSRFFRIFGHNFFTTVRDYSVRAAEKPLSAKKRKLILTLNLIRRFFRQRDMFIEVSLGIFLFSIFSFGELNIKLLVIFALLSSGIFFSLSGLFFRIPLGSNSPLASIHPGASSDRVYNFKVTWAVMSLLLFSLLFGGALRGHREGTITCIHYSDSEERASIILFTGDVIISAAKNNSGNLVYSATPINKVVQITSC